MKTRSNMPLFVVECNDIKALSNSQIDLLRCGDYLVKKTGNQRHAYKVTYKEDKQGICLTYHDASCVETVSYDYTDGNWVYNSTDVTPIPTDEDIADVVEENVIANPELAGTEDALTGLQVGDTKYAVPQPSAGSSLHIYTFTADNHHFEYMTDAEFDLSNSTTALASLMADLKAKGYTYLDWYAYDSDIYLTSLTDRFRQIIGLAFENSGSTKPCIIYNAFKFETDGTTVTITQTDWATHLNVSSVSNFKKKV